LPDIVASQSNLVENNDPSHAPVVVAHTPPGHTPAPDRLKSLQAAHFNTHLLPHEHVEIDLLTDSWGELSAKERRSAGDPIQSAEERFRQIYGYPHVLSVTRGRFAEALLAAALVRPGTTVACNALFPSTRFHAESRGATLVDIGVKEREPLV